MDIPKENKSIVSPTLLVSAVSLLLTIGVFSNFFDILGLGLNGGLSFDFFALLFSLFSLIFSIFRIKRDKFGGYLLVANIIIFLISFGFAAALFLLAALGALSHSSL